MNKTLGLILIVLLLGGVTAFFVWDRDDNTDFTPDGSELVVENDQANEPIESDPLEAGDPVPTEGGEELPEGLEAISRQELAGGKGAPSLVVQVWDRKKGVPAAKAEVFFLEGAKGPEFGNPFAQHWSDFAEQRGQRFKTDDKGQVKLPPVKASAIVAAKRDGAFGFTRIGRRHKQVETILLQMDEAVTVRVVDSAGKPVANAPVGVVQKVPMRAGQFNQMMAQMKDLQRQMADVEARVAQNPDLRGRAGRRVQGIRVRQRELKEQMGKLKGAWGAKKGRGPKGQKNKNAKPQITSRPELRARRLTDKNGIATFKHFQVYRRQQQKWWPPEHVDQFEAVLMIPLRQPDGRPFAGRPVPKETIELRMPPTGSITLRTVDLMGRPFPRPVHATLAIDISKCETLKVMPWSRTDKRKLQDDTTIEFPFIGLGMQFVAHCRLDDRDFRWTTPAFAGPLSAGEQIKVDVVVAPDKGMLTGRVVDDSGKPLASVLSRFVINSAGGRVEGETMTLDRDGRFQMPFVMAQRHRPPYSLLVRRDDVRPAAGVTLPLKALPVGKVMDLGDLSLDAFNTIVHGNVVDDRGEPVAGAIVQLQRERTNLGRNGQPTVRFIDEHYQNVRTDAKGHYEMYGDLELGRYRLRVNAPRHLPLQAKDQRDLRVGQQLDIQLQRESQVVGTVLAPKWLPGHGLRVVLESPMDKSLRREDRVHDNRGQKFVYFNRVRPGVYSVLLRIRAFPDPIHRIDGIEVKAGQQGVHSRLRDINLNNIVHRFQLAAVNELGQPIKPNWPLLAQIVRPGGKTGFIGLKWRGTNLEIVSASAQLEVWPFASGFRAERAVLVAGKCQVRFLSVPPVDVVVPGLRRLVGKRFVRITMQPTAATGLPGKLETFDRQSNRMSGWFSKMQGSAGAQLGNNDTARIRLSNDGRYKVIARLHGAGKMKKVRPVLVQLGTVQVRLIAGAGPQKVRVNADPKKVQAALTQLAQREAAAGQGK